MGLRNNSPTPSSDAKEGEAPSEYATTTVVSVPKIL